MSTGDAAAPAPAGAVGNHAAVFAALGDATRLSLLMRLSRGDAQSISALAADTRLTRQAITKHLQVLEEVGLVGGAKIGREHRYGFRPEPLAHAMSCLRSVAAQWDDAIGRLQVFVGD
ncbi:ArsR/SmtB family transcription factor [Mangrovicella endophytica]|uniref:ArsR/SmtB family transcription factor n=1 Tax=Mangrovicella endophytica TaxID=2066697 RepID=UPI000C9E19B6|nr:metalloregulator ArsR/SmtB family transcription factor [Mangrovicella endophytica]